MQQERYINNRYRVIRALPRQGRELLYLVEDRCSPGPQKQQVALKILPVSEDQARLMLRAHHQLAISPARHPHLAQRLDFGALHPDDLPEAAPDGARCFYTREYIEGLEVTAYCKDRGLVEKCIVFQRIADLLDVLHCTRMIHGRLKTSNIIVSPDGWPHLVDYGLLWDPQDLSGESAAYLAPEVLQGKPLDEQSDLYALGISLYQVITGHLPFNDADLNELIVWHLKGSPLRVSVESTVPAEVDDIIFRLTHRDPSLRFPAAIDTSLALEDAARNLGAVAPTVEKNDAIFAAQQVAIQEPGEKLESAITQRLLDHTGGPALLAIEGEQGSGKSSLLRQLGQRFQLAGVDVFLTRFSSQDPRPNGPWPHLLGQVAALSCLEHPLQRRDIHRDPLFTICRRIEAFLSRSSEQRPLLLLFDDVEQAGQEAESILRFLSMVIPPTALVQLVAAHLPDERVHEALGRPNRAEIRPLSEASLEELLRGITSLEDHTLPRRLLQHTEGSPVRVNFVLSRLHEIGWGEGEDLTALSPQSSDHDIYLTRWQGLGKSEQTVLQILAVLGRPTSLTLLRRVLQEKDEELPLLALLASLGRLQQLDWLSGTAGDLQFFHHGPTAAVVYQATAEERRRELHIAAASAVAADGGHPFEQAWHFAQAQCPASAMALAPQIFKGVGLKSIMARLMAQVIQLFEGQAEELSQVRLELGVMLCDIRCPEEAALQLRLALDEHEPHAQIPARLALARALREGGSPRKALQILEAVLAESQTSPDQVTLLVETAKVYAALDLYGKTQQITSKALLLLDARPEQQDLTAHASIQGLFAWSLGLQGRDAEAAPHFDAALEEIHQHGDINTEIAILCLQIQWELQRPRYPEAASLFERAIELAAQIGDIQQEAILIHRLATIKLDRGQYAESLGLMIVCLRLFEAMQMGDSAADARCQLGQLELLLGLYEQGLETLTSLIQEARAEGRRLVEARALVTLAQLQFRRLRPDKARVSLGAGREILLEEEELEEATGALLDLAELEFRQDSLEQAQAALKLAEPEVEQGSSEPLKVRLAAYQALAMMRGENSAEQSLANAILEEALETAIALDIPAITWECHAIAMELADTSGFVNMAVKHAVAATSILVEMAYGLSEEFMASFWHDSLRRKVRDRAAPEDLLEEDDSLLQDDASFRSPLEAALLTMADRAGSMQRLESPPSLAEIEELLAHQRSLYRILSIYSHLNWEVDPEKMLTEIMDALMELTDASRCSVLLQHKTLQTLVARNSDGKASAHEFNRPIVDFVFRSGHPVITESKVQDPRFEESPRGNQTNSVFCIPIRSSGKIIGVLYAESSRDRERFTGPEQRLLKALADLVAVMLTQTGMAPK